MGGGKELKKGPWTAEEDEVLIEFVRKHGEGNWNNVRKKGGLMRCGKSCRLRWVNHLRSNLKKGSFTSQEESQIVSLQAKFGNRWSLIALHLPGRTDNEIKNFWNTRLKRHIRLDLPLYPPEVIREHQHLRLPHHQQPKQPLQIRIQPSSSLSSLHQANRNFSLIPSSSSSSHMENPNFNLIPSSSSSHMETPKFNLIPSSSSSSHMENPKFNLIPSSSSSSHMENPNFSLIPSSSSSSHMENPNFSLIPSSSSSSHMENPNFSLIPSSSSSLHMENPNFSLIPSPSSSSHMENPNFNLIPSPSSSSHMETPKYNLIPSSSSALHMESPKFNLIPSSSSALHMESPKFNLIPSSSSTSHMENPNFNLIPSSSSFSHMENPNFIPSSSSSSHTQKPNFIPSSSSSSHTQKPNFIPSSSSSSHTQKPNFIPCSSSSSHTQKPNFNPYSSLSSSPLQENFGLSSIPSSWPSSHDQTNCDINPIPTLSLINPIPSNQLLSTFYHPESMSKFNPQSGNDGGATLLPLPSQNLPLSSSTIPHLDQSQLTPYGMNPMPTMDACRDDFLYENLEMEIPSVQSSFQAITPTSSSATWNDHIVVPSNGEKDNYSVAPELIPERNSGLLQDVVGQSIALLRSQLPSKEDKLTNDDQSESIGRGIMHDNAISKMNVHDNNVNLDSVLGSSCNGKTRVEDSSFGLLSIDMGVTSQAHEFEDLNMMNDDFLSWIDFEPPQELNHESDDASAKLAINVFNGTMATTIENQQDELSATPSESNHDWATKDIFSPIATIPDEISVRERGYMRPGFS